MKEGLTFYKIEGGGNDFIVLNNTDGSLDEVKDISALALKLCPRGKSAGADGLIIIENSDKADIRMIYYNADGSWAALCGNGLRALGLLSRHLGITGSKLNVETDSGIYSLEITGENRAKNSFNPPVVKDKELKLDCDGSSFDGVSIDVGIPFYAIILDSKEELERLDVKKYGSFFRYHEHFQPEGTNVTFIYPEKRDRIWIRIYERGVEDETLSSGTGSYSSAAACTVRGVADTRISVNSKGGEVVVGYKFDGERFKDSWLEGQVSIIYKGLFLSNYI